MKRRESWLLPASILIRLEALEAQAAYDSSEYQKIMLEELYPKMLCRIAPWLEPVQRSFRHANQAIYNEMQGKSEFVVTGDLKGWNRWDRLHEIATRTLTIGATYDEMDPRDLIKLAKLMPKASSIICPRGSHMSMWDDQAFYFENLLAFLKTL